MTNKLLNTIAIQEPMKFKKPVLDKVKLYHEETPDEFNLSINKLLSRGINLRAVRRKK